MKEYKIMDVHKIDVDIVECFFDDDSEIVFLVEKQEYDWRNSISVGYISDIIEARIRENIIKKACYSNKFYEEIEKKMSGMEKRIGLKPNDKVSILDIASAYDSYICVIYQKESEVKNNRVSCIVKNYGDEIYIYEYKEGYFEKVIKKNVLDKYNNAYYRRRKIRFNLSEPSYIIYPNDEDVMNCSQVNVVLKNILDCFVCEETIAYIESSFIDDDCDNCKVNKEEMIVSEGTLEYLNYINGLYSTEEVEELDKLLETVEDIGIKMDILGERAYNRCEMNKDDKYSYMKERKIIKCKRIWKNYEQICLHDVYWYEADIDTIKNHYDYYEENTVMILNKRNINNYLYILYFDEESLYVYEKNKGSFNKEIWKRIKECFPNSKKDGRRIKII